MFRKILIALGIGSAVLIIFCIIIVCLFEFLYQRAQIIAEKLSPDHRHKVVLRNAEAGPEDVTSYRYDILYGYGFIWYKQFSVRCLLPVDPDTPKDRGIWMLTEHEFLGWKDNRHFLIKVSIPDDKRYKPTTAVVDIRSPKIPCIPQRI